MAKKKLTEQQEMKIASDRQMQVYKRDDMIQTGRHELTLQEQRCVLYAMSKIKPEDSVFQEYTFDLGYFYDLCGLQGDSYTELKSILIGLKQKTWWVETAPNVESTVSWFNKVRTNKKSGTVTVRFDDDMMPYLLELTKQGKFYTHYELQYILPMKSQYSVRLYELLKSYQKNNYEWFFEVDTLKKLLNCENYKNFNDFSKRVLVPAVAEINHFSDIKIAWEPVKHGRKVVRVSFYMVAKKKTALLEAQRAISEELDGQYDIEQFYTEHQNSVKAEFFRENLGKDKE